MMTSLDAITLRRRLVLGIFAALLGLPAHATICVESRIEVRSVQGIVVDDAREPFLLPGAEVTLARGDWSRTVTTDEDGYFSFRSVPPGDYRLRVQLEGFRSAVSDIHVRDTSDSQNVLVVTLVISLDGCTYVEVVPWREALRIQRARSRSSR